MASAARVLKLSGFGGIVAGMVIGLYQVMLRDPTLLGGASAAPPWLLGAHVHFFGLSLIVLFYAYYVDDLFAGYRQLTAGAAVVGQWGIPLVVIVAYGTGIQPLNALQLPLAAINIGVAVAFLVNAARRGV